MNEKTTVKKKAVKKKQQIAKAKPQALQTLSPEAQVMDKLMASIGKGLEVEQLKMVLDAQERILDRQNRMDYASAMSMCQADIPDVLKGEWNDQTKSKFEDLEALNKAIRPVYTKYGFAVSFSTGKAENPEWLRMIATITHASGWSETSYIDLPYDDKGIKGSVNKTMVHATASTRTYARRYLLKEIFNITTTDDVDNDGNGDSVELISEEQSNAIHSRITDNDLNMDIFMEWLKKAFINVNAIDDIPAESFATVIGKIDHSIANAKKVAS